MHFASCYEFQEWKTRLKMLKGNLFRVTVSGETNWRIVALSNVFFCLPRLDVGSISCNVRSLRMLYHTGVVFQRCSVCPWDIRLIELADCKQRVRVGQDEIHCELMETYRILYLFNWKSTLKWSVRHTIFPVHAGQNPKSQHFVTWKSVMHDAS